MNTWNMTKFFSRSLFILPAAVLFLGGGVFIYYRSGNSGAEPVAVRRGTVVETVAISGKTEAAERVELAFERSGRIGFVAVRVGDRVLSGQTLAALNASGLAADLAEAEASVLAERAALAEGISLQEVRVENAGTSLADARKNLLDKIADAYAKSDDAVRNRTDQLFSSPRSVRPQLTLVLADSVLEANTESMRFRLEGLLTEWQASLAGLGISSDLAAAARRSRERLNDVAAFNDTMNLVISGQSVADTVRSDLSTGRTNIQTAIANLSAAEEKVAGAESALALAERELAIKKGAEGVAVAEAKLRQAEAKAESIRVELSKTVLRSPLAGIVTKQEAKTGQIASANQVLAAVMSESQFEIEADIPEISIGKVRIGNPVAITLDAFPGETFSGRVTAIEPAETIVGGVVNFKTTVAFDSADPRLKSGLSADLTIETARREQVLLLPLRALIENGRGTFVRKREGESEREVPVEIGIRGASGDAQIVSGLSEGDLVFPASEPAPGNGLTHRRQR